MSLAVFAGTPRFEVVRMLGAGGMGEVYEVVDRDDDARLALKVLRRMDARVFYRFKREFRSLQELSHRGLVSLGELHEVGGLWFFTMELVDGADLLAHAAGDLARLRAALAQLAEALAFLHAAGKIHRDVKPSNVMVGGDGRVVLLDFGLVTEVDAELQSSDGEIVGTPAYMAPEQASSQVIGPPADCYALGVLMYEALTGELPFDGTPAQIVVAKQGAAPPDPRVRNPDAPADLARLCQRLLDVDPDRRPSAAEVHAALAGGPRRPGNVSQTRAPLFVGRDAELAQLDDALEATLAARAPVVVHLHGTSGVGKSALVQQFVSGVRGRRADALVLTGRCYERELTHYRAFDGVIDAVVRRLWAMPAAEVEHITPADAALLVRMFPMFDGVPSFAGAPRPPRSTDQDARTRAYLALRELMGALARRSTLVVIVDDLQWADDDSLRLLAELLRGPQAPPALYLLASRRRGDDEGATARWLAGALPVEPRALPLHPLSSGLAERLAASLLDAAGLAGERAAEIAAESAGHPLHIAELVRHVGDGSPGERGRRLRLDQAIVERLGRLPEAARELALLVALAGAPIRPGTLRRAATASALEFQRALTQLRVGHLIKRGGAADDELVEPYHDRVREALVASLDDGARRALHGRLASAMIAAADRSELLVHHLDGAGQPERAARAAVDAARRAASAMAFHRAAELFRTALRLGALSAGERRELTIEMADALARAGHGHAAASAYTEAADGADPEVRLRCHRLAAEQLLISGYIDEGLHAIAELLGEVGTALPPTPRRALWSLIRGRLALAVRGKRWTARHEAQVAPEKLARLDVYKAVAHGLSMVDNIRGADFNARFLRLALDTGEPVRLCRALGMEALFLGSQGPRGHRRAHDVLAAVERLAREQDSPVAHAWHIGTEAVLRYFAAEMRASADGIARAEALFADLGVTEGYELNNLRMFRSFALSSSGEVDELRPLYVQWLAEAEQRGDRYAETMLRRRCGIVWLAAGEPAAALDSLARAHWTPPEGRFHLQHWYEIQARAEAALCLGRARELVADVDRGLAQLQLSKLSRIHIVRCTARWLQARIHVAAGTPGAARIARDSAAALAREGLRFTTLLAALVDASAAEDPVPALTRAIALCDADTRMHEAAARTRLAERAVPDADAHAARASALYTALGVTDTAAITQLLIPRPR